MDIQQRIDSRAASLLTQLAIGCHNGACNPRALLNDLVKGIEIELSHADGIYKMKRDPRVEYIVAHIAFLFGQAIGPDHKTFEHVKNMADHTAIDRSQEFNPINDIQRINQVVHFVGLYNRHQISTRGCLDEIKKIVSN
jgi:hypothetical protein